MFSGGCGTIKIFELGTAQKVETIDLTRGSPRDLLALVEGGGRGASDALLSMILSEDYKKFDVIQNLIPGECIITRESVIPGLLGEMFPQPDKDIKKDVDPKFNKALV